MTTFDNMENQDASEKDNDRARFDRMVEPQEQKTSAVLAREGIAPHEAERARNPIRSRTGRRVDARECEKIDRKRDEALNILATMLGV